MDPQAALVERVCGEFLEMPGLRLTTVQAARLWDVDHGTATAVLESLEARRFLVRRGDQYARRLT